MDAIANGDNIGATLPLFQLAAHRGNQHIAGPQPVKDLDLIPKSMGTDDNTAEGVRRNGDFSRGCT
jgi:hypothetical protein